MEQSVYYSNHVAVTLTRRPLESVFMIISPRKGARGSKDSERTDYLLCSMMNKLEATVSGGNPQSIA